MKTALPLVVLATGLCSFACSSSDQTANAVGAGGTASTSVSTSSSGSTSSNGFTSSSASTSSNGSTSSSGGAGAGGSSAGAGGGGTTDEYGPWAGGPTYYTKWPHGPSSDPSFFPISVWLQSAVNAPAFEAIGFNTYIGLYNGPVEADLTTLKADKMPVACDQNAVGLAHVADPTILAWTQEDEPDNAQAVGTGYGPCVPASEIVTLYNQMQSNDATRPVFLNLGQGVAHDYNGWGSVCAMTHPADYPMYIDGSDIISFDIYPMNETDAPVAGHPEFVAKGVDNLMLWSGAKKPVWNWIECTGINAPSGKPTPEVVKAEVWMSIVHGSMGIGYFVHQILPTFDEHALLDDPTMKPAVGAINAQIHDLAPVLNTPPIINGGTVASSAATVPVDMLLKRQGGATYIFAVAMANGTTMATFSGLTNLPANASVTVLGENRTIAIANATFSDAFTGYGVHLYQIK